jgi:hypothetical protein
MLTWHSRGKLSEYSHQINEDDPRDVEMIQVCDDCRIAVVRKRVHDPEIRAVRVVTSIWVFSDDNTIRMELRMDDEQMYIPYSSYFSPTMVSITVPCELKFHDVKYGNRPANYAFETQDGTHTSGILLNAHGANVISQPPRYFRTSSWGARSSPPSGPRRRCVSTKA